MANRNELLLTLLVKFPVVHGRQDCSLAFRICEMVGQKVAETSVTEAGPVPGASGNTQAKQLFEATAAWGLACYFISVSVL